MYILFFGNFNLKTIAVVFVEQLLDKAPFPEDIIARMDQLYGLSSVKSSEIRFRWQMLCLKANYASIFSKVVAFVTEQGRMKYVRPLYR